MARIAMNTRAWARIVCYERVRILLALVLLVAAALKGHQLATSPVMGDGMFESRWVLIGTVEFELFFGLWLLANNLPVWTHRALLLCFGVFAAVSLYKAVSGAASCGCFGRVEVNPWFTFTLDVTAVLALLRWRPSRGGRSVRRPSRELLSRVGYVAMVWFVLGVPAAIAMGTYEGTVLSGDGIIVGTDNLVVLEPEKWVGHPMPLLPFIQDAPAQLRPNRKPLRDRLVEGEWIVVFYRHDCPKCQEQLPKYEMLARRSAIDADAPHVALIEIPPYGGLHQQLLPPDTACVLGRLNDEKDWFIETPVQLTISVGGVVNVVLSFAK